MPALAKPPANLPRFVPHINRGASAGAGPFSKPDSTTESVIAPTSLLAESLDCLAHDARNVLSSLMLYSGLLAVPGVLHEQHSHYAQELEGIARSSAQILEKIVSAIEGRGANPRAPEAAPETPALPLATSAPLPPVPVTDAAGELRHLQPLLAAIAGPAIKLSVATMPCIGRTTLAVEDLTRILVNLVRNAADAMPSGGHLRITAQYGDGFSFLDPGCGAAFGSPHSILLTVSDDGPGIPESLRPHIFDLGFTTRDHKSHWPTPRRRGLGLSIVRNLVIAAGGTVRAVPSQTGARFEISLPIAEPVTSGTYALPPQSAFPADSHATGCLECH